MSTRGRGCLGLWSLAPALFVFLIFPERQDEQGICERIAFSIVRADVRYPGGIVSIVLQYGSSNRIYLCIGTMSFEI